MIPALAESIERIFDVFGRYPKPPALVACSQCEETEASQLLLRTPLRQIAAFAFGDHFVCAMSLHGAQDELRYFLRRILELVVADPAGLLNGVMLFGQRPSGNWLSWPEDEQVVLRSFMSAFWEDQLLGETHTRSRCGDALHALSESNESVEPFLNRWTSLLNGPAASQLRDFVYRNIGKAIGRQTLGWHCEPQESQVIRWMLSNELVQCVQANFETAQDETVLHALAETLDYPPPVTIA